MELNERSVGPILLGMSLLFSGTGVALPFFGMYWPIALAAVGPFLVWIALNLLSERLTVTTEGVYHLQGRGLIPRPQIEDAATWDQITGVELKVKLETNSTGPSRSYTLVFDRPGAQPLR